MKRRLFSVILAIAVLLTTVDVSVFAAEVQDSKVAKINEQTVSGDAIEDAVDGNGVQNSEESEKRLSIGNL